jgi:hypothetical protein
MTLFFREYAFENETISPVMVYLDESANGEIVSKDPTGFKTFVMEKKPQTMTIKPMPVTKGFNLRKKKEAAVRKIRDPAAKIPKGKSGNRFPARIPDTSDSVTGISGGKLKFSFVFTYSHLLV